MGTGKVNLFHSHHNICKLVAFVMAFRFLYPNQLVIRINKNVCVGGVKEALFSERGGPSMTHAPL